MRRGRADLHARVRCAASRGMLWALALLLAGCAAGPLRPAGGERDGPEANPPADLARVPDAEPMLEPIRSGGPNKPYDALGQRYVPITSDAPFTERGLASWYGKKFQGRRTASGEVYNMYAMTAAHPTLPIPSYARVRNPANGREVVVRINDRGPFYPGRIVDLSYTAALKLDLLRGVGAVELQRITFDEIRTGAWRRAAPDAGATRLASAARDTAQAPVAVPLQAVQPVALAASAGGADRAAAPRPAPPASEPAPAAGPLRAVESLPTVEPPPNVEPMPAVEPMPKGEPLPAIEPLRDAPAARAYTGAARGWWVQLGAFRQRGGAEGFQQRVASELDWLAPLLAVFNDASMYRLQAGPYPSRDEARRAAERARTALQLVPVLVERR